MKRKFIHFGLFIIGLIGLSCITLVGTAIVLTREERRADRFHAEGFDLAQTSQFQEALASWEKALLLYKEIGHKEGEANILNNMGTVYDSIGDYQQAIDSHIQALDIAREIEYSRIEATAFNNLGNVYNSSGKYQRAINFHEKALDIAKRFLDRSQEAKSLGNLGLSYHYLGDYKKAIRFQEESLEILRPIKDRKGESQALTNLGLSYHSLGDYKRAIDIHQLSLEISREINNPIGEAYSLGNLGNIYISLGNYQQANDLFVYSLKISREVGSRAGESANLSDLAGIHYEQENYKRSLELYKESLSIDKEIFNKQGELTSLGNIGMVYSALGDTQKAAEYHQRSLNGAREIGDRSGEIASLINLGTVFFDHEQGEKVLSLHEEALEVARNINSRSTEATILENIGTYYANKGNQDKAEEFLLESTYIQDGLRTTSLIDRDRISLFEKQSNGYKKLEVSLISQRKFKEAMEVAERSRARSFVQTLIDRQSSIADSEKVVKPLSASEIQKIAEDQQSVLVEYSLVIDKEESLIHIWVIQPTGDIQFRKISLGSNSSRLSELVSTSRQSMGIRGRGSSVSKSDGKELPDTEIKLRELHQLLIRPISDLLPTEPEQRVVFVPQGELFLVPFPALIDSSGNYLVEQHTILTSPSIQLLDLTNNRLKPSTSIADGEALIVGNPTMPKIWDPETKATEQLPSLPGTQKEAEAISTILQVPVLMGDNATEHAVKQKISDADIVHLATHGLLDYGTPENSGIRDVPGVIALANGENEDGLLTSAEIIEELSLKADLVVLSACDTGLGNITSDGVIGLSRSFITAGASSTVVSLWSIPDAPTATLMAEFYRQMKQGQDKAQALRQAMLITMSSYPNPRDWAAFTLIGKAD